MYNLKYIYIKMEEKEKRLQLYTRIHKQLRTRFFKRLPYPPPSKSTQESKLHLLQFQHFFLEYLSSIKKQNPFAYFFLVFSNLLEWNEEIIGHLFNELTNSHNKYNEFYIYLSCSLTLVVQIWSIIIHVIPWTQSFSFNNLKILKQ